MEAIALVVAWVLVGCVLLGDVMDLVVWIMKRGRVRMKWESMAYSALRLMTAVVLKYLAS